MALISKLTAIADAIRSKTGGTEALTLDGMVTEIEGIEVGGKDYLAMMLNDTLTDYSSEEATCVTNYAFSNRYNLESVNLPYATTIGSNAFYSCTGLKSCVFSRLTNIENTAFKKCSALTAFVIEQEDSVCVLGHDNIFESTPIEDGEGYIYVPDALVDSYKSARNWSVYADHIKPVSEYVS